MNALDQVDFSNMLSAELAYTMSKQKEKTKRQYIKSWLKSASTRKDSDSINRLTKKYLKKTNQWSNWDLYLNQYLRILDTLNKTKSLNDTERLKLLFDELNGKGFLTVWAIDSTFEAKGEQVSRLHEKGMISVHKNQLKKVNSNFNFPSKQHDDLLTLTVYGNPKQVLRGITVIQRYGFDCYHENLEKGVNFVSILSACDSQVNKQLV